MKKIPYYNGEPFDAPSVRDVTSFGCMTSIDPTQTSDRRWYKHHQAAEADFTDLSFRTTKDDAIFWLRTR